MGSFKNGVFYSALIHIVVPAGYLSEKTSGRIGLFIKTAKLDKITLYHFVLVGPGPVAEGFSSDILQNPSQFFKEGEFDKMEREKDAGSKRAVHTLPG